MENILKNILKGSLKNGLKNSLKPTRKPPQKPVSNHMPKSIPRPEHPCPQLQRENWLNLNGEWNFAFDFGDSGEDRKWQEKTELEQKIIVPFCPESKLSGIGYKDFIPAVWYQRKISFSKEQLNGRILLHFGAVDYACTVWVNGQKAGEHTGGYVSFVFDITEYAAEGDNNLTVRARDDGRSGKQPRGKQCGAYDSAGCDYTRTTGIWQTVWLEFVPKQYIRCVQYYPNIKERTLTIKAEVCGNGILSAEAFYKGQPCGSANAQNSSDIVCLTLFLTECHLWEPGCGRLYELKLSFTPADGDLDYSLDRNNYDTSINTVSKDNISNPCEIDYVNSYFGMREVQLALDGERFFINGKSVFQRLVLDQGFYPDGIYTAPNEAALIHDIEISLNAGFNGARLHQKIFEPRFLYHCDRLGYLVWGEHANWGLDYSAPEALKYFLPEWMEAVKRDFNHPAIIGWCPFNETWDYNGRKQDDRLLTIVYQMTKAYDTTRPCIDTSGNYHVITDIYDIHDYEQNPKEFADHYEPFKNGGELWDNHAYRQKMTKKVPVFISEYGGIKWDAEKKLENGWGYGNAPKTEEQFIARYKALTNVLLDHPKMFGFCYTQLYDIEQELNGLYTYDRKPKFDMEIFKKINERKAAIETESAVVDEETANEKTQQSSINEARVINGKTYIENAPHDIGELLEIVSILRSPQGCSWDKAQTHESMKQCLTDETEEVIEAIDKKDNENLCEELGDILLQVLLHSEIAKEEGAFDFSDVVQAISDKMIRRHPHVFGNRKAPQTPEEGMELWTEIKQKEKK